MHLVAIHRMIGLPGSPVDFARMWSGKVSHIDTDKKMKATWFMPITRADILLLTFCKFVVVVKDRRTRL